MSKEHLFQEFPSVSEEEWRAKVEKDLKGRAISELQWHIGEDMVIEPFYTQSKGAAVPSLGKSNNEWEIAEEFHLETNDIKATNKAILDSLMGGVNAPIIRVDVLKKEDWARLLNEVKLEYISLHIRLKNKETEEENLASFKEYLASIGKDIASIKGSISPCRYRPNWALKTMGIDAISLYKGEENIPKELAHILTAAVDKITDEVKDSSELKGAMSKFFFSLSIGTSYFPSIAKLRALRILWERICRAYEVEYVRPELEVSISPSAYDMDSNLNMIRATTVAMSAVIGGADRLVVLPSESLMTQPPSSFSRRIARNVQHLLKMESFMDKVADPAAGSYYIEHLTAIFVEKAWEKFLSNN